MRRLLLALVPALLVSFAPAPGTARPAAGASRPAGPGAGRPAQSVEELRSRDEAILVAAFRTQQSDVWVEVSGVVTKLLADDRKGSRHQRFLVRVADEVTVLVAHNIDLAPRVPAKSGDLVELRGEYEWNAKGGVLHWTHRDPDRKRRGGFVRLRGVVYE